MARLAILCATILGSLSATAPVCAQRAIDFAHNANWMAGYVANAPQQLLGVGAWAMPSPRHRWGLYADGKRRFESPAGDALDRTMTPADADALGDRFFKEAAAWTTVNLAAVRGLSSDLAVYLGGGLSRRTMYVQYVDETQTRGQGGQYWVVDDDLTGTFVNVLGGAFFRATARVAFQFGAEAAPAGATVGVHLRLR
jgi:hypothetical protein